MLFATQHIIISTLGQFGAIICVPSPCSCVFSLKLTFQPCLTLENRK